MKLGKKIALMLTAIMLTTIVAAGVYFTSAFNYSTSEFGKTYHDLKLSGKSSKAIDKNEPFSILLMGVDTGSGSRTDAWEGNSDSMILVTVNPKTKRTTLTSLERDILVKLSGPKSNDMTGAEAKLNAAYYSGQAEMAMMTVEDLLDIKIDQYMQINMQGLVDLVDAIGGISVTNPFDFDISIEEQEPEYTSTIAPGTHKVNGDQALVFSRMRYQDPEGDYGRQTRQREVIGKIVKKMLSVDSISSYRKVLRAVGSNMRTDIAITNRSIPKLLKYRAALGNIVNYQLRGEDATLADGGSYQVVTSEHLLQVQNKIKSELGLPKSKKLKTTNATLYEKLYWGYELEELEHEETEETSELVPVPSSEVPVQIPTPPVVTESTYAPVNQPVPAPIQELPLQTYIVTEVPVQTYSVIQEVSIQEVPVQEVPQYEYYTGY